MEDAYILEINYMIDVLELIHSEVSHRKLLQMHLIECYIGPNESKLLVSGRYSSYIF